jgi:hypothetical protein
MIATPYYAYHPDSVWNRNQLGDLSTLMGNLPLMLAVAAVGYVFFVYKPKRG